MMWKLAQDREVERRRAVVVPGSEVALILPARHESEKP
jgi:hypothetical protein